MSEKVNYWKFVYILKEIEYQEELIRETNGLQEYAKEKRINLDFITLFNKLKYLMKKDMEEYHKELEKLNYSKEVFQKALEDEKLKWKNEKKYYKCEECGCNYDLVHFRETKDSDEIKTHCDRCFFKVKEVKNIIVEIPISITEFIKNRKKFNKIN